MACSTCGKDGHDNKSCTMCTICTQDDHPRKNCKMCTRCFTTGHKFLDCPNDAVAKSPYQLFKQAGFPSQSAGLVATTNEASSSLTIDASTQTDPVVATGNEAYFSSATAPLTQTTAALTPTASFVATKNASSFGPTRDASTQTVPLVATGNEAPLSSATAASARPASTSATENQPSFISAPAASAQPASEVVPAENSPSYFTEADVEELAPVLVLVASSIPGQPASVVAPVPSTYTDPCLVEQDPSWAQSRLPFVLDEGVVRQVVVRMPPRSAYPAVVEQSSAIAPMPSPSPAQLAVEQDSSWAQSGQPFVMDEGVMQRIIVRLPPLSAYPAAVEQAVPAAVPVLPPISRHVPREQAAPVVQAAPAVARVTMPRRPAAAMPRRPAAAMPSFGSFDSSDQASVVQAAPAVAPVALPIQAPVVQAAPAVAPVPAPSSVQSASTQTASQSGPRRGKAPATASQHTEPGNKPQREIPGYNRQEPEEQRLSLPNPNRPDTKHYKITSTSENYAGNDAKSGPAPKGESKTLDTLNSNDENLWLSGWRPNFVAEPVGNNSFNVLTNHFRLPKIPIAVHRYSLKFPQAQSIKGRKEYRRIFVAICNIDATEQDHNRVFPKDARWGTDFEFLWSLDKLNLPTGERHFDVQIQKEAGGLSRVLDVALVHDEEFTLNYRDVHDLSGPPPGVESASGLVPTEFARAFNALISRFVVFREDGLDENQSVITQLGANRFFVNRACRHLSLAGRNMPVLYGNTGFFMSVRPGNTEPLLNVNTAATAFYAPISVADFIVNMGLANDSAGRHFEALKRIKVKICYKRSKASLNQPENQIKRITGFGDNPRAQTFQSDDAAPGNRQMTVEAYFRGLNVSLQQMGLRCVNVGFVNKPQWIPPECLQIVPWQPAPQSLVKHFSDSIIKLACRSPLENRNLIGGKGLEDMMLHSLMQNPPPVTDLPDFQITPSMLQVPARRLLAPTIAAKTGYKETSIHPGIDNSWRLNQYLEAKHFAKKTFAVVNLVVGDQPPYNYASAKPFAKEMEGVLKNKGLGIILDAGESRDGSAPQVISPMRLRGSLLGGLQSLKNNDAVLFVILVIERRSIPDFQMIKHIADCIIGLPVFVCLHKNVMQSGPRLRQFCEIFSLKICTRLVGATHSLHGQKIKGIDPTDTLVMGADVTHPSPGSRPGTPSIAAVVSNIDQLWMKWPGSLSIQESRKEMITHMEGMAGQRMLAWKRFQASKGNHSVLKNIIFYRDGVSESQYDDVLTSEVEAIRRAYQTAFPSNTTVPAKVKITVIICAKRHHVRFYPEKDDTARTTRSGNLPAGTVVERVVTSPWRFDWFLQSHYSGIGTARSTHYIVIRNDLHLRPEQLQRFTNDLCYVWGRATKPVSLVPPAYYADVLCERGRCFLSRWSSYEDGAPAPDPPFKNRSTNETEAAFKLRILDFVQTHYWQSEANITGLSRGTEIINPSRAHGPWHASFDNTMFYI